MLSFGWMTIFKNGKRHGQGIFNYADGGRYEGGFKNGKRHGQGIYSIIKKSKKGKKIEKKILRPEKLIL